MPTSRGGSGRRATGSTRARSATPTVTGSAICAGSPRTSTTSPLGVVKAIGCRSSDRRWPTSATTATEYCDVDLFGTLRTRRAGRDLPRRRHPRGDRWYRTTRPTNTRRSRSRARAATARARRYVWRRGNGGRRAAQRWTSQFRPVGPSWTLDTATGQWYLLDSFMAEQPDLNLHNPEVRGRDARRDPLLDGPRRRRPAADDEIDKIARTGSCATTSASAGTRGLGAPSTSACADPPRDRRKYHDGWSSARSRCTLHRVVGYNSPPATSSASRDNFVFVSCRGTPTRPHVDRRLRGARGSRGVAWLLSNHDKSRAATRLGTDHARAAVLLRTRWRRHAVHLPGRGTGTAGRGIPPKRVVDVDGRDGERAPLPWTATPPASSARAAVVAVVADAAEFQVAPGQGRRPALDARVLVSWRHSAATSRCSYRRQRFLDAVDVSAWCVATRSWRRSNSARAGAVDLTGCSCCRPTGSSRRAGRARARAGPRVIVPEGLATAAAPPCPAQSSSSAPSQPGQAVGGRPPLSWRPRESTSSCPRVNAYTRSPPQQHGEVAVRDRRSPRSSIRAR